MKQADVKIGETYYTKIGDRQEKVVVVDQINDVYSGRVRFRVRKAKAGSPVLPKSRASSALWPLEKYEAMVREVHAKPRPVEAATLFPVGSMVFVDGAQARITQVFPEGSSSYEFPHYKVSFVGGDQNVAVALHRVTI